MADTLTSLADSAARELRRALESTGDVRTGHLRQFAERLVEAREYHTLRDGSADLKGSSYGYRMWAADVYSLAGVSREQRQQIQASVSYHVSAIQRTRYKPEELGAHGLQEKSAKERGEERRKREAAVVRLFEGAHPITDAREAAQALGVMLTTVKRMSDDIQPKAVTRALSAAVKAFDESAVESNRVAAKAVSSPK